MSKIEMNEDRRTLPKPVMLTHEEAQQVAAGCFPKLPPWRDQILNPGSGPYNPFGPS
jgi:hypothetical protein